MNNRNNFEIMVNFFKERTCFDEVVIGCYLSNYGNRHICSGCQSCGCKSLKKCEAMKELERKSKNE